MSNFTPRDVEAICGVKPESLRNWRRLGLAPGLGNETETGRFLYPKGHLLRIAIAKEIEALGVDLRSSFEIAGEMTPFVGDALRGYPTVPFFACWPASKTKWSEPETRILTGRPFGDMQFIRLVDPRRVPLYAKTGVILLHVEGLAAELPERVKELYRAHGSDAE